jgi:phage-related protein
MSDREDRPLVVLSGEIKTPPLSERARREAGFHLRMLQAGESLSLPISRPLPAIGPRCHELRIVDRGHNWRIIYRTDPDAVLVVAVLDKKTPALSRQMIDTCKRRLREYDEAAEGK